MKAPQYPVYLSLDNWQKVIQSLRNEAFQLTQESNRACEKGSLEYGTMLWEECSIHNNLALEVESFLPAQD
jgi:hypothetical protein